jgi:hypothetical protein
MQEGDHTAIPHVTLNAVPGWLATAARRHLMIVKQTGLCATSRSTMLGSASLSNSSSLLIMATASAKQRKGTSKPRVAAGMRLLAADTSCLLAF